MLDVVEPVAVQPLNPLGSVIVGDVGIVKLAGNTTVTVLPFPIVVTGVNPTVQVTLVWFAAAFAPAPNVTAVGVPAAAMVTDPLGCAAVVSALVCTLKVVFANACAEGFTTAAIVSVAAVFAASAQVPPLFASVIVTVCEAVDPVAEQSVNALPIVIVGAAGTKNTLGKPTVIVLPLTRLPLELPLTAEEVKPTVQLERALPV